MMTFLRPPGRLLCGLALTMVLVAGSIGLIRQIRGMVIPMLPVARLWFDPDAQARTMLGDVPYDLLQAVQAVLPADATVLLVTNGRDVRHVEYTTFHRALYYLAPRAVWWLSPAPPDGTWEARWWISAPLTTESVAAAATSHGATHLLVVGLDELLPLGHLQLRTADGYLLALGEASPPAPDQTRATASEPSLPGRVVRLLFGLGTILLWGWLVLTAAGDLGHSARRGVEAWALAWALGAGVITLAMAALNTLGLRLDSQIIVLVVMATGFGLVRLAWHLTHRPRALAPVTGNNHEPPGPSPAAAPTRRRYQALRRILITALLCLLFVQLGTVILSAMGQPLRVWDSWVTWGMKARVIFLDGSITPAVYGDPSRAVTLPGYPLLVPLVEAWLYGWMGSADDRLVGIVSVLWYLSLGGVVYGTLRRLRAGRLYALAVTVAILLIPGIAGWAQAGT